MWIKEQVSAKWNTIRSDKDSNNFMKYTLPKLYKNIVCQKVNHIAYLICCIHFFSTAIDGIIEVPLPLSNFMWV